MSKMIDWSGITVTDGSDVSNVRAVASFQWKELNPETLEPVPSGAGKFLGYVARGYGAYLPGGNPVLHGPRRETLAEAKADAADPRRVLWRVVGYTCG